MVMVSIHTIMSTTSSCQPRHHVNAIIKQLGSVRVQKRANSRMETLSGAKPCVFSGNVAPGVAEVGSLFPRFRALIWEVSDKKRTGARARFALQKCKNTCGVQITFGKFIDSLVHWFVEFLIHWFIQGAVHGFFRFIVISTTICSFVDAPHNFDTSLLLHRKNFPIGHWYSHLLFSKLPPLAGTIWYTIILVWFSMILPFYFGVALFIFMSIQ